MNGTPMAEIVRGDTLEWPCVARNDDGTPMNLTGFSIASQVRRANGQLIAAFAVTITDAPAGKFTLSSPKTETATWPLGDHLSDIEFTDPLGKTFTVPTRSPMVVRVHGDQTQP